MKKCIISGVVGYFVLFGILYLGSVYGSLEPNPFQWSVEGRLVHAWFSIMGVVVGVAYTANSRNE